MSEVNSMMGVRLRVVTKSESQYKELLIKLVAIYPSISWTSPKMNEEHEFVSFINFKGSPHYREPYPMYPQYNSSASK